MTYDEFRTAVKQKEFQPLYFFTGEEDFLQSFTIADVKKALIDPSFEDFNYKCYIEPPTFEDASSFITALPLMSERKLVVFNSCNMFSASLSEKNKWEQLFSSLPPYVVCIVREKGADKGKKGSVVEQAVKKCGITVDFEYLPEPRLRQWLMKAAVSKGKSLDEREATYIIKNLGRGMTLLKTEIEKICAKAEQAVITRSDIDSVIRNVLEESIFTLIDAIFASRRDIAFSTLENLRLTGNEPVPILELFASQTIDIYRAKLMLTQKTSITDVKKSISRNPYAAEKLVSKATRTSLERIESLIAMQTAADKAIKTGTMDPWCSLEMIIAN